jgi:hypothetical protein
MVTEMKIECAWCNADMGTKPGTCSIGDTSHAICDTCMDKTMPAPRIDERMVTRVQFLGGRDVHRRAQVLQAYTGAAESFKLETDIKERFKLRKIWLSAHTQLRHMLEHARDTKLVGG